LFLISSFATVTITKPPINASQILLSVGKTDQKISLLELSQIKRKDFEKLSAEKLNFFDRLNFKVTQKKVRKLVNPDGTIKAERFEKFMQQWGERRFHFGGFLLGLLLGPIGVIICYFINDDYKQDRVRSAWRGFLSFITITLLILRLSGVY
jgi:hypothetical protein